jgi:GT2 family glycosyltransferase
MDLSVIIVSYRGWEKLIKCLEALDGFSQSVFRMEVIVADNDSDDMKLDELETRFNSVRFIRNDVNGGFAYGCNRGASEASGDIFMFLNPDTIVSERAISSLLLKSRQNPEYKIISCRQVNQEGKEIRAYGKFPGPSADKLNKRSNLSAVIFPDWISGSLMMMSKETYFQLNGFDESFWMYYEDVDFCRRTRDKGWEIAFFRDTDIRHDHGGSSRVNLKTTAITKCAVQASRHLYIHKHLKGSGRFLYHSITIADNLITGIITAAAGFILFFIPKLFVRVLILVRLLEYYTGVIAGRTWVSRRSVLYKNPAGK